MQMTRPVHVSILKEGTLCKFRLLFLANRLRCRSEILRRGLWNADEDKTIAKAIPLVKSILQSKRKHKID